MSPVPTGTLLLVVVLLGVKSGQTQEDDRQFVYIKYPVLGQDANVSCGGDEIVVTLSQGYLLRHQQWLGRGQWLTLVDPACRSSSLPNGDAVIRIEGDFTGCGNKVSVMETLSEIGKIQVKQYKFSNRLMHETGGGMVSRQINLLNFDCIYPAYQMITTVESQVDIYVIQIEKISGQMTVYQNRSLDDPNDMSMDISSSDTLHVHVIVNEPMMTDVSNVTFDFVSVIDSCWITTREDTSSGNVTLINDGCPSHGNVEILTNSMSLSGRFSMKMFSILSMGATNPTLHCLVKICNRTSDDGCIPICNSERQKRSLVESTNETNLSDDNGVKFYVKSNKEELVLDLPSLATEDQESEPVLDFSHVFTTEPADGATETASMEMRKSSSFLLVTLVVAVGVVVVVIISMAVLLHKLIGNRRRRMRRKSTLTY